MREYFVHEAVLAMDPGADLRAPGGAVTLALCGAWDHVPPCPLAAHHCRTRLRGPVARTRVVFTAEPEQELRVRRLVDEALSAGTLTDPQGVTSTWRLRGSKAAAPTARERARGRRLAKG
ncbi:hypothetical protein LVY72_02230 [Arthrobacter sp. I2-34]|uniref:Uncharacterized protein n=1 Tax=Arthrobacter hankyongi TaxID=2904801 RepID=A0ABS9L268_9MICC|nr:hypothetical protein [Arthrobacter hankyongi]MCG2620725.1 hypothetical protein [Arthrobacter hankyongi]